MYTWIAVEKPPEGVNRRGFGVGFKRGTDGRRLWVAYDPSWTIHRVSAREAMRQAVFIDADNMDPAV